MIVVRPSPIHGNGVFTTRPLPAGRLVQSPHFSRGFRGYNHSCAPNAYFHQNDVRTLRDVCGDEEITLKYMRDRVCLCGSCSISVDERNSMLHDQDMGSEHIEAAILKLETLRDEQLAAGDKMRAALTALEIERMEKNMVYK